MATESALSRFLTTTTVLTETSASFGLAAGRSSLATGLACSPGLAGVGSLPPDASGGFDAPHAKASPITKPAATANTVPRVMATPDGPSLRLDHAQPQYSPLNSLDDSRRTRLSVHNRRRRAGQKLPPRWWNTRGRGNHHVTGGCNGDRTR